MKDFYKFKLQSNMSLGIFVDADGWLKKDLEGWKAKINSTELNNQYTAHPSHLTLINVNVENENEAANYVSSQFKIFDKFRINIKKKDIFWDDSLTDGHTLYYKVEKNNHLFKLQKHLAKILIPIKTDSKVPKIISQNKILYKSYLKYGSPFIGDHWIPHFTVSSLKTNKEDPIITEFLKKKIKYSIEIVNLSLWKINGDCHHFIKYLV